MEDFIIKMVAATFYVIIGGAILAWVFDKFATAMLQISQATVKDVMGAMIIVGIITVVALLI